VKKAIVNGHPVQAGPNAPAEGLCPACGDPVELRSLKETWYYRHREGYGQYCGKRERTMFRRIAEYASETPVVDPPTALAMAITEITVKDTRQGSLPALLSLAFSEVIHRTLDVVDLSPEEVLDRLVPQEQKRLKTHVLITDDEVRVLKAVRRSPGPVFDLRGMRPLKRLEQLPLYVPLDPGAHDQLRMVGRVMSQVDRAYVLGDEATWRKVVDDDLYL